ncbi:uncharacterized protein BDW70DRAFT_129716 [Aspergillus foveolatus]|uniref:uncharacterized protein n=1 Tax=Aspergillus foveolatus TaxID=210207 RepID=UPI003CCE46AF
MPVPDSHSHSQTAAVPLSCPSFRCLPPSFLISLPLWYSILCSNLNGYRHHHLDLRRHLAVINYRFPLLSSGVRSDTPFWSDSLLSSLSPRCDSSTLLSVIPTLFLDSLVGSSRLPQPVFFHPIVLLSQVPGPSPSTPATPRLLPINRRRFGPIRFYYCNSGLPPSFASRRPVCRSVCSSIINTLLSSIGFSLGLGWAPVS